MNLADTSVCCSLIRRFEEAVLRELFIYFIIWWWCFYEGALGEEQWYSGAMIARPICATSLTSWAGWFHKVCYNILQKQKRVFLGGGGESGGEIPKLAIAQSKPPANYCVTMVNDQGGGFAALSLYFPSLAVSLCANLKD